MRNQTQRKKSKLVSHTVSNDRNEQNVGISRRRLSLQDEEENKTLGLLHLLNLRFKDIDS